MSPQEQFKNVGKRGTPMAVATGVAIVSLLGGMWLMGRDVKQKEGQVSPYGSDDAGYKAMSSKEVRDTVVVPKPGTDRLSSIAARKTET